MKNEKLFIKRITAKVIKFYIGDTAMRIADILRENCVSERTRLLVMQHGYDNAYTALAYQCNFKRDATYDAILDDMQLVTKMQFTLLPNFVHQLLQHEQVSSTKQKLEFSKAVLQKAVSLIGTDIFAANDEALKKAYDAEIPF